MLFIRNECLDPHHNLALEEYVLKNLDLHDNCILLWQNEPSVIIGRFQNTIEEINVDYIKKNNIHVVRRITGGGAVYHDLGNLNFTFIEKAESGNIDFRKFTEPVVKALAALGIKAEHTGRNDITIDGKKFSGNAQYIYKGKVLHHGTILFASRLENVQEALNVKADKIESKGVKSVRSRVTNVSDYLKEKITIQEFREILLNALFEGKPVQEYKLTENDLANIRELTAEKYLTWEWNFGHSPAFNFKKSGRFACGGIEVNLFVDKGIIQDCKIYGDFFSNRDLGELEAQLKGLRFEEKEIAQKLANIDITQFFGAITHEELLSCFMV